MLVFSMLKKPVLAHNNLDNWSIQRHFHSNLCADICGQCGGADEEA